MTDVRDECGNRFENVILMSEYARCIADGSIGVHLKPKEVLTVVAVDAYENGEVEIADLRKKLQKRVRDNSSRFSLNNAMPLSSITEHPFKKSKNDNNYQSNTQSSDGISFASDDIDGIESSDEFKDIYSVKGLDFDAEIGLDAETNSDSGSDSDIDIDSSNKNT